MAQEGNLPSKKYLDKLLGSLSHRGPDGQGKYEFGDTVLLQTRLAIVDLKNGDQPLFFKPFEEDPPLALVANGEIYNDLELRQKNPIKFMTNSDCEPILFLYNQYGSDYAKHLRGMYAIALHDPVKNQLILSRDPFGIKPLYYCFSKLGFIFASEFQAFLKAGALKPNVKTQVSEELLQLQFTTGKQTILEGIHRVLPGETLIVQGGNIIEKKILQALPQPKPNSLKQNDALTKLDMILEKSVSMHQRSDVPYGMFLSGGVDSSTLLAMMCRLNTDPVHTFTAGFENCEIHDERPHARFLAKLVGATHEEIEFGELDFWSLLPEIVGAMDEPAADYAILPTYKLAAQAKLAGLKVVLSGEGADEIFAGYGRYRRALRPSLFGKRELRRRGILSGLGILQNESEKWRFGFEKVEKKIDKKYSKLQRLQALDCSDWLPNDLLTKLDRCLMAHGIEGRVPFLDSKLVYFAYQLQDKFKIHNQTGKWLLRVWLNEFFPEADAFSRKRGFTVPVGGWIAGKKYKLGPLIAKQEGVAEICNVNSVLSLYESLSGVDKKLNQAAWVLLYYALWHNWHVLGRRNCGSVLEALS